MKVCIVTTRHISCNPRVLKEADTLDATGHEVTVVAVNNNILQRKLDLALYERPPYKPGSPTARSMSQKLC